MYVYCMFVIPLMKFFFLYISKQNFVTFKKLTWKNIP